jgi:hypothetical protein
MEQTFMFTGDDKLVALFDVSFKPAREVLHVGGRAGAKDDLVLVLGTKQLARLFRRTEYALRCGHRDAVVRTC